MTQSIDGMIRESRLEFNGKIYRVTLTTRYLTWEPVSSGGLPDHRHHGHADVDVNACRTAVDHLQTLNLQEVIGVKSQDCSDNETDVIKYRNSETACRTDHSFCIELRRFDRVSFIVYGLKKLSGHHLGYNTYVFKCKDASCCQNWVDTIKKVLELPDFKRPKRLLIFVNPFGGKKRGPKIYREKVAPLLDLADIHTDVILTQRVNHARDVVLECDLDKIDGLVCVGGDGMFSELLNGLLTRTMKDRGLLQGRDHIPIVPDLRVGIIPAGSTDTVVYTTVGTNDPVTAALHIILGNSLGIDVCSIYQKDELLKYSVSLLGYGYYGDVLMDSEKNRWMGTKRYDWSGFKKLMANKSYDGEVSFLLSSNSDSHPRDGVVCYAGCDVCKQQKTVDRDKSKTVIENGGWHHIRGRFVGINSFTMSCRCNLSPGGPSPSSHLGDGYTDLMLVYSCSRTNYLRHLYRCAAKTSDQFDFNFIKVHRVKEFNFKPLFDDDDREEEGGVFSPMHHKLKSVSAGNSVWNCDGEVINNPYIDVRVHCQLINIFARGIEPANVQGDVCTKCCISGDREKGFLEY